MPQILGDKERKASMCGDAGTYPDKC